MGSGPSGPVPSAEWIRMAFSNAAEKAFGLSTLRSCTTSAAIPAAVGAALDVPWAELYRYGAGPRLSDMMLLPFATTSGLMRPSAVGPKLVNADGLISVSPFGPPVIGKRSSIDPTQRT